MEENFETTNDIPNPALIKKLKKEEKSRKLKVAKAKQLAIKKKEKSIKQILFEKKKAEERKIKFTNEDQLSRLEKYDLEDSKDADNNPFIADENFKGPERINYFSSIFFFFFLSL